MTSGRCARFATRSARPPGSGSTPTAPGTSRPRSGRSRARGAGRRARRAAGGQLGGGGRRRRVDLDPDRRRREYRSRATPSGRRRWAPGSADRGQAFEGRRAPRRRTGSPRCSRPTSRAPSTARSGSPPPPTSPQTLSEAAGERPDLAHGLATQRLFASTVAAGRVRAARRHARIPPSGPGPGGRDRRGGAPGAPPLAWCGGCARPDRH